MMIQIERLSGPEAGRATTHSPGERVTFGRAADNTMRLAGRHVSRYHGELIWQGDQWLLLCHSANGLTVGKRHVAGGQTFSLTRGETVSVEGEPLFAFELIGGDATGQGPMTTNSFASNTGTFAAAADPTGAGASTTAAVGGPSPEPATGAGGAMSRRGKVWVGIGAYMLIVIVGFIALSGLSAQRQAEAAMPGQLPDARIAREIRAPIERLPNERESARHLALAQRWYARSESSPDGLFLTHYHYKLARAYAGLERGETFDDGLDQLRYQEVEQRLTARMQRDYREAFALAHNREWQAAERALRSLLLSYTPPPDQHSAIVDNLEQQLRVVMRSKPKQRFR